MDVFTEKYDFHSVQLIFLVCKYKRGRWSECNPVTNMKVMVKMLKRGDPAHCEASTTVERKCKRKSKTPGASKGMCCFCQASKP